MLVAQEVEEGNADENVENVNAGDTVEGDVSAANDEVPTVDEEPSIPSPIPPTPPPQPSQDIPSTFQVQPTLPQSPQVQLQSLQPQPPPTQDAEIPMNLLQEVMNTCTALTRRVEHLELDKIAQALEITKLKIRVKKLERRNKVKVLKLRRLQKVGTGQIIETSNDTVMDDVSNQGRMITEIDADVDVVLEEAKEVAADAKADQDAKVDESVDIQGRQAESQAEIDKIDLDNANKVLSMHEDESEPAEVQKVVDVVTVKIYHFDNDISFEEEVVHQRLRKTLTHVLELSSCIYLDDRAWGVLNFDSAGMRINLRRTSFTGFPAQSNSSSNTIALDSPHLLVSIPKRLKADNTRMSWNEFSSSMASVVICLSSGKKFDFTKYIFDSLVRNVDSPTKFYMYLCFLQLMIRKQVGDLSTHTTKYTSPALTQKVFANMRRVGKGFSGVETPLFKGMVVAQEVGKGVADEVNDEGVPAVGVATEGVVSAADDVVLTADEEPFISSLPPPTPPPQPSHDIPYTPQEEESEPAELQEVVDIVTTAKIIIEVVTAASITITAVDVPIPAATTTVALTLTAAPTKFDSNVAFLQNIKEQIDEEESRALKRINKTLTEKAAKRQKLDEEVEELKRHLQIVPNDDDDVYTEATP
nr:hypothetical protein [Tanacetum cinerariifolium]